jgi:membrane protein
MYLSSYVLLFGAEMNSELEHQTAKDTTAGSSAPLGQRGAWAADHVAGGESREPKPAESAKAAAAETAQPASRGQFIAARTTDRVCRVAGLRKVGLFSSVLSTAGLALLRRRGRTGTGAALLVTAAGLSLLKRE